MDASSVLKEVLDEEENLQEQEKTRNWKEKSPAWRFLRQTADVAGEDSCRWLRNGF